MVMVGSSLPLDQIYHPIRMLHLLKQVPFRIGDVYEDSHQPIFTKDPLVKKSEWSSLKVLISLVEYCLYLLCCWTTCSTTPSTPLY
jgi:hypothetical protein